MKKEQNLHFSVRKPQSYKKADVCKLMRSAENWFSMPRENQISTLIADGNPFQKYPKFFFT